MSFLAKTNAQFPPITVTDRDQADGNVEVNANSNCDKFVFTVIPSSGATGTLAFSIRPHSTASFEPIIDPDTNNQQIITLNGTSRTFVLLDYFSNGFRIEPTSVTGTYSVVIQQGTA